MPSGMCRTYKTKFMMRQFCRCFVCAALCFLLTVPTLSAKRIRYCELIQEAGPAKRCSVRNFGGSSVRNLDYSVVILGDTHYDTDPPETYHSNYRDKEEWLERVRRAEFARNALMWSERCPRLLDRCASLVDSSTVMVLQTGDLIQGDCGKGEVHRKMLDDVMNAFKAKFRSLPFVTVAGNHDIRGTDARKVYDEYMPARMSGELGIPVQGTTFAFMVGPDAYIVVDFTHPDAAELDRLLKKTKGARHTFVLVHGPVFPMDAANCRWFLFGGKSEAQEAARKHFRAEFAKRKAIVLCGHSHATALTEWKGDGGVITQLEMNSVWAREKQGTYPYPADNPDAYGRFRQNIKKMPDGSAVKDESALFYEYRPGITRYIHSYTAGSFKMNVSRKSVTVDFYAGDSEKVTYTYIIR